MHLIVLTLFVVLLLGVFSIYPGIVFAKHEEKLDSDSDKQSVPNNDGSKSESGSKMLANDSTDVPTVGNVVIPIQQG